MHKQLPTIVPRFCWLLLVVQLPVLVTSSDSTWLSARLGLPRIYEYDDFDTCRRGDPNFQYCVLQANILSDPDSSVWRNITVISADIRNFPHAQLERGVCWRKCLETLLAQGSITAAEIDRIGVVMQFQPIAGRLQRQKTYMSRCINSELRRSHGLQAATSVVHCLSENDFERPFDLAEFLFIALVASLVLLVAVAARQRHQTTTGSLSDLISSFSASDNINQLLNGAARGDTRLRFLEGLRAIFMLIILVVHSSLPVIRMPLKNSEEMELQTTSFVFPFINSGNTHMITFFFALGGMVQAVSFLAAMEKSSATTLGPKFLLNKLLHRLARLLPAYGFVIFYQATLFKRTKQTPVAHKFIDYCDAHWWSNVLFINNYAHLDEPCLKFGWYLGADLQLFVVGLIVMMLIWRLPRLKTVCISAMLAVAFVAPGYVIYKERLDATMGFDMKHALSELRFYREFLVYYTTTPTNSGTYFFGMLAGMLYHHLSRRKDLQVKAEQSINQLFRTVLPLFLALNGFLTILPTMVIEKPSLFLAIFGSALKAIWGIAHGTLFLLFAFRSKSQVVAFLEHPILMVLAKLSYAIYLVQYSIIYMIYSNVSVPMTYGAFNSIFITSAILFMTLVAGILLHVAVEVPCGNILRDAIEGKLNIRKTVSGERVETVREKLS